MGTPTFLGMLKSTRKAEGFSMERARPWSEGALRRVASVMEALRRRSPVVKDTVAAEELFWPSYRPFTVAFISISRFSPELFSLSLHRCELWLLRRGWMNRGKRLCFRQFIKTSLCFIEFIFTIKNVVLNYNLYQFRTKIDSDENMF